MFRLYIYSFPLLTAAAIVLATLCAIKCGTALLAASNVPRIAVFAAVVNTAFVAYRARSDPIMSTLVYNHNDAAKRAVISEYSLRVNCFNLSNTSNT